ncbi:MAG: alpha/beta hydrolase-fold protein [Fimbriimonadaceae bacterium]
MRPILLLAALTLGAISTAQTNVRAVFAHGQTFVVWEETPPNPVWVSIYRSNQPISDTSQGTLVGRLFAGEWNGERLDEGSQRVRNQGATWRIPTNGSGGRYQLTTEEGLFVNTPRASGMKYYSVVPFGQTSIAPDQITQAPVQEIYAPNLDPIIPHVQYVAVSAQGYLTIAYAFWVMGDDDPMNDRPDFPVAANRAKNGMPVQFLVSAPENGPGAAPYAMSIGLHGGEGNFYYFRAGMFPNIGQDITDGILITPVDDFYFMTGAGVRRQMSRWFGWNKDYDPFDPVGRTQDPPADTIIANYTQRRMKWMIDWLMDQSRSGFEVDPNRVTIYGHSAGGRGALNLSRYLPTYFGAVNAFCPAIVAFVEEGENDMFGSEGLNLQTNIVVNGVPVRYYDAINWTTRLSEHRDIPFTRIYNGKREYNDGGNNWDAQRTDYHREANDSRDGFHLFWDERDHGVADWSEDDPTNTWNDVGQWITNDPLQRTLKGTVMELRRHRPDRSYPAFFDYDEDPVAPGRQPDPGDGDPDTGTLWGTWAGYLDWDMDTIIDTPARWATTFWVTGLSTCPTDNYPGPAVIASVAIRRPQQFQPPAGTKLVWTLRNAANGNVLQRGVGRVGSDGVVEVRGLVIRKDPIRSRLEVGLRSKPGVRVP